MRLPAIFTLSNIQQKHYFIRSIKKIRVRSNVDKPSLSTYNDITLVYPLFDILEERMM